MDAILMQQLRKDLEVLLREVCQKASGLEMPIQDWLHVEKWDDSGMHYRWERRHDYKTLLKEINVESLESFKDLVETVRGDPDLASTLLQVNVEFHHQWAAMGVVRGLRMYFDQVQAVQFDEPVFTQIFEQFVEELRGKRPSVTQVSPLWGVRMMTEKCTVAPGIELRQLSEDEIDYFYNTRLAPNSGAAPKVSQMLPHSGWVRSYPKIPQYAIEITYDWTAGAEEKDEDDARERAVNFVTPLRLLAGHRVDIFLTERRWPTLLPTDLGGTLLGTLRPQSKKVYNITEDDCNKLADLAMQLRGSPNLSKVNLALGRWNTGIERERDDDRLVDFWIALESLYVTDGTAEIRYRAGLRLAAYLGDTGDERLELLKDIRHSYDWRSAIVHGGTNKYEKYSKKRNLADTTNLTGAVVRKTLLKLLAAPAPVDLTDI
jgi:hypothetical protein